MKKNKKVSLVFPGVKKLVLAMKISILLLFISVVSATANSGYSQSAKLTLNLKEASVREVIEQIEQSSEFIFIFYDDIIDLDRKINISVKDETIDNILDKVFESSENTYVIFDRQIVIAAKGTEIPNTFIGNNVVQQPQRKEIKGLVTDPKGQPLPGVAVLVKGTTIGITTGADGRFTLSIPADAQTLLFSFVGMETQEVAINGQTTFSVSMAEETIGIEEVVAIGYGTIKRSDVTGAVASVSSKSLNSMPIANIVQGIQGKASGVDITTNERPGEIGKVLIRGVRSITASNDPLYVVDGIPLSAGGIDAINPQDIETIDILKDASATAIYGSRGANGVILITTKKGRSGKTSLSYNGTLTITTLFDYSDYMNSEQYIEYRRNAYREANKYPDAPNHDSDYDIFNGSGDPTAWANIEKGWASGTWDGSKVPNTDWAGYVVHTGITNEHTLTASGGTDKIQAIGSFGYLKQTGTNKGQDYERYSAKVGVDIEPTKWFKMGANITSSWSIQNYGYTGTGSRGATAIYSATMGMYPYAGPYDSDGNWIYLPGGFTNVVNPIEEYKNVIDERKILRALGSFYAEIKFSDWLKYRVNFGPDFRQYRKGEFRTASSILQGTGNGVNYTSFNAAQNFSYTLDNLIYFNKKFGKHDVGATLLQTASDSRYEYYTMTAKDLEWDEQLWYSFGLNDLDSKGSGYTRTSLTSYMARVNYGFSDKYLLTLSGRWDGASQLAEGHKWDFFPSAALGWRMDQETFVKDIDWINQLKLRAGIGTTGNAAIEAYDTQGGIAHIFYPFSSTYESGYYASDYMLASPPKMANKELGWEKTTQFNLGIDFSVLNNRITGTFDLYKSNTNDLLMNMSIPSITGYTSTLANVGKTSNRGIDISLNTRNIDTQDFQWTTDLTFSANKVKIEELANGKNDDVTNLWFIGEDINVAYDYKKIGIWQTADAEEMTKYNANGHTYEAGDIKVKDLGPDEGDNKIDPNNDRKVIGSYNPKWMGGMNNTFNYKDFELSFFIYARWGFLMNGGAADMQGIYQSRNIDYWRKDNPTNAYPKADYNNGGQPIYYSAMNYQDGSFIKMRYINLGYNFPKNIVSKLGVSTAKVYVQAMNPFMIYSKCDFLDGDQTMGNVKSTNNNFRATSVSSRSWVFGISVTF